MQLPTLFAVLSRVSEISKDWTRVSVQSTYYFLEKMTTLACVSS